MYSVLVLKVKLYFISYGLATNVKESFYENRAVSNNFKWTPGGPILVGRFTGIVHFTRNVHCYGLGIFRRSNQQKPRVAGFSCFRDFSA